MQCKRFKVSNAKLNSHLGIISTCNFEKVKTVNLTSYGKNLLVNNHENKLYQVNGKRIICKGLNIQVLITNEGFLLMSDIEKAKT